MFLMSILSVSCSNADKTGTTSNDDKTGTLSFDQFKGTTYYLETDNTKYVSINQDGSITIKVNPTADEFPANLIKHISGNKYTFSPEPQYEDIYTIEFIDNGDRIILIYGSKDYPLYFKK